MSEMGEYWQEKKINDQIERAKKLKWNTDIVMWKAAEYDFKVRWNTEHHMSLFHPKRGRFDYYPSTDKGIWFKNNKQIGKTFPIKDIELYLIEHFKPI